MTAVNIFCYFFRLKTIIFKTNYCYSLIFREVKGIWKNMELVIFIINLYCNDINVWKFIWKHLSIGTRRKQNFKKIVDVKEGWLVMECPLYSRFKANSFKSRLLKLNCQCCRWLSFAWYQKGVSAGKFNNHPNNI